MAPDHNGILPPGPLAVGLHALFPGEPGPRPVRSFAEASRQFLTAVANTGLSPESPLWREQDGDIYAGLNPGAIKVARVDLDGSVRTIDGKPADMSEAPPSSPTRKP